MAKPRVFVSSTFYDLKYVRSSLEIFISSLGFEPILFEKGDIAFNPDVALDESCYREAQAADIFVLIIGGRYGTPTSSTTLDAEKKPAETFESITRKEFESAQTESVPTFILIEGSVHSEYRTYLRNKENKINYAHVDSVNVFRLIETIFDRKKNNPVHSFYKAEDIESWLREQWAGLFRELLKRRSQERQLATLNSQVAELQSINTTLKNYLEAVLNKVSPDASANLIREETEKLREEKANRLIENSNFFRYAQGVLKDDAASRRIIFEPNNRQQLIDLVRSIEPDETNRMRIFDIILGLDDAQDDYNQVRISNGRPPIDFTTRPQKTIRRREENNKS